MFRNVLIKGSRDSGMNHRLELIERAGIPIQCPAPVCPANLPLPPIINRSANGGCGDNSRFGVNLCRLHGVLVRRLFSPQPSSVSWTRCSQHQQSVFLASLLPPASCEKGSTVVALAADWTPTTLPHLSRAPSVSVHVLGPPRLSFALGVEYPCLRWPHG